MSQLLEPLKRVARTYFPKPLIYLKSKIARPTTQNSEGLILQTLLTRFDVPKCFIEFGFGGWEFNCAPLVYEWEGLLLDGDPYNITIADIAFPRHVTAKQVWITLETLDVVHQYARGRDIGILSVDVDGNDYWFLENLIVLKPAIIIAEYNSTFGLRPITIPYDPDFDYQKAHPTWTYYGASLTALAHLTQQHGYRLIEVDVAGINAFFVRSDLLGPDDRPLSPENAYREQLHADRSRPSQRWEKIKALPFVDVTKPVKRTRARATRKPGK